MKVAAITSAVLAGSASAFAPAHKGRASVAINAEKSAALPFLNRPPLVSSAKLLRPHLRLLVGNTPMVW